jgi:hypothetical protein
VLLCSLLLFFSYSSSALTDTLNVAAGNCSGCHGPDRVLPLDHPDTNGQNLSDCRECHAVPQASLRGKISLKHVHHLAGLECSDCHLPADPPAPVTPDLCLACHGGVRKIAEATAGPAHTPNPHESPHYGRELDCDLCHHIHGASENFCNQCHEYGFVVP